MFSVAQYRETVLSESGSVPADTYYEETDVATNQLLIQQKRLKAELARIDNALKGNKRFRNFVAKRKMVAAELSTISNKLSRLEKEKESEEQQLAFFKSENMVEIFDKRITAVPIRRSKESLEYELKRREILFDKYGVQNIQSYIKLHNAGVAEEQLPILIVVIDEFAEFKKTFPKFMKWVESSFARGRSVGIWFILATQQPGSEASEAIKTNTHFKWCLKVNTAAASKEMVGI